jgi:ATP-dependent protease ClpP protease subunit
MKKELFIMGEIGWSVMAADIAEKLASKDFKDAEEIIVNISSPGGSVDEGFAIYDLLKNSGKKITMKGFGMVASIATVIFMAGDTRELTTNSTFMVHNSKMFPGWDGLEASDLKKMAERAQEVENKIVDFYVNSVDLEEEEIRSMMNEETFMNSEDAVSKGFATAVTEETENRAFKAVAYFNEIPVNKPAKEDKAPSWFKAFAEKFKNIGTIEVSNTLLSVDGQDMDLFIEGEATGEELVGSLVFWADAEGNQTDEVPEDGDYTSDGQVYTVESGTISAVKEAEEEPITPAEPNEETAAQIEALTEAVTSIPDMVQAAIAANTEAILAKVSGSYTPPTDGGGQHQNTLVVAAGETAFDMLKKKQKEANKK